MTRVVIAGLGDSGLLTAIQLARSSAARRDLEVVGVSSKPMLVSGQELGIRLARPDDWRRDYLVDFARYRKLHGTRFVHGSLTGLDLERRTVAVTRPDHTSYDEPWDVLVISTGVSNGFWRRPGLESPAEVEAGLRAAHERLAGGASIAVVGGGAAAVSSAVNLATAFPEQRVDLWFPGERALPAHHGKVWADVSQRLEELGVGLHPGHRAVVPDGFDLDEITRGPVSWSTGQPPAEADAVLWAIGRVRPNTGWLPAELLDADGFVRTDPDLRVPGQPRVFAIGDVAATDPLRSSARNRADKVLARNIVADLAGRPLKRMRAPRRRWGSVTGVQPEGVDIYFPSGQKLRFPGWTARVVMQDLIARRVIYGGIRKG
ncbi:FAD-dependent oxidoreductase [Nocardioides sp.]|uniref:FAD-dependent oxidoreductase n=1 Tax=Nocardioides sp. TaxID=35761 RepID=UPI002724CCE0|nr:FAD-dependent oxidoreductase [Nocardioides sp.]MDO9457675.1 FAD-dependent oxidoreductase [Nocardioides sp.]